MEQHNFAKLSYPISLPDLIGLQKSSYSNFLQIDKKPEERELQGLHAALLDVFGDASECANCSKSEKLGGFSKCKKCSVYESFVKNADESVILQYNFYSENKKSNGLLNYDINSPRRSPEEAKTKGLSLEAPLKIHFRLLREYETGKIKELSEQEVFFCDVPLMTESGTFIINGAERVIVNQIHRSPGVIFEEDDERVVSQLGKKLFKASIIPYRGAWLDFEFDIANVLYVRIDKKRKIPSTALLHALGFETDSDVLKIFYNVVAYEKKDFSKCVGMILAEDVVDRKTGEIIREANQEIRPENIKAFEGKVDSINVISIDKEKNDVTIHLTLKEEKKFLKGDKKSKKEEAIGLIYKIMRTPEFVTPAIAEFYLENLLFKTRKYDLSKVGRYKLNKKLQNVFKELEKNQYLKKLGFAMPGERKKFLTKEDIISVIKYIIELNNNTDGFELDDVDHLGNRRVRSVGELLENQIRIGFISIARLLKDRMGSSMDNKSALTPRTLINPMPLIVAIRRFFGTSQLSQFMDKTNPLAELTHKRRLSALGPGGLHRKRAGFEVRDVHYTHYGRICPIETPEGPNIGLITSLACYARVNEYGLIETPYRKVEKGKVTEKIEYLTADREDDYVIAQANAAIDKNNNLSSASVACRSIGGDVRFDIEPRAVNFIDISPMQLVSVSTALIPFLEHDDANRALMGSNMQRQAVPLLITQFPLVATGIENKVAVDAFAVIIAKRAGEVIYVSSTEIAIISEEGGVDTYYLIKYNRSNQDTYINYSPIVNKGDKVRKNEVIADGSCTDIGQLALGQNVNVAFMSWEGYNFEDAIIVSERLIRDDLFTSIHIKEFQIEARDTKIGQEEITRDIPNVGADDLLNLDELGIIRVGAEVIPGDILVGKTVPKGEQQVTVEERLLKAIFGKKAEDVIDASLRVPPGIKGKVINVQVLTRWEKSTKKIEKKRNEEITEEFKRKIKNMENLCETAISQKTGKEKEKIAKYFEKKKKELEEERTKNREQLKKGDELPITVNKIVKVFIASKRKLQVGDKLAGRHGNKGVVSKIMSIADMPRLPNGDPIDIILSPLSIPSRMNVGQLFEAMLGWSANVLGKQMLSPVFDGATEEEIGAVVREAKEFLKSKGGSENKYLPTDDCKITLYDGRTGEPYLEKVTVGNMYLMKLVHLVEDKIHARSTGPYSLITRQPLGGKAQFGGQRLGEMEVWAIEGYGAAYTLQEFLTVKSDDVNGRMRVYESIIKGETLTEGGVPESFKVLVKELQGIGLNIELLSGKESKGKEVPAGLKPEKEKISV